MNHPNAALANVLTFMWRMWKSRNDALFNRKQGHPAQIHFMANTPNHSLEMLHVLQDKSINKQVQSRDLFSQGQREKKAQMQKQMPAKGSTIN